MCFDEEATIFGSSIINFIVKSRILLLFFLFSLGTVLSQETVPREFRGVWVATVGNIDWPSKKDLSAEQQKKEIIELLDLFKRMNFNAIVFQIRPAADAFYNSKYEPWSYYLNGTNNKPPYPYYDPLAFIIEESHKRGMEFHAWLNPYRAVVNYKEFRSNPFPLTYEKPEWFINYGNNKYFDPGLPEVRVYTNKVVADIVQNYDIDAIHFDDYFYPYKIKDQTFNDERSFKLYGSEYTSEQKDDWRRQNVNLIIEELFYTIKSIKPWVQFGISPFGVWRNKSDDQRGSPTEAGQTNYDDLYADVLYWMKKGWLDYVLPQAYWHIGHDKVDYKKIIDWWAENSFGANLYIGHSMYRLADKNENEAWNLENPTQIERQLKLNASMSEVKGSVFFSAKSFFKNPFKINDQLLNHFYQYPSLQPIVNDKVKFAPQPPINAKLSKIKNKQYLLHWDSLPDKKEYEAVKYMVYLFDENENLDFGNKSKFVALTGESQVVIPKKTMASHGKFMIIGVSRNNNISSPVSVEF